MRLHLTLRARKDCAFEPQYHRGLMGRFSRALEDTRHGGLHEERETAPFVFSDPIPPRPHYDAGDTLSFVVASPHDGVLSTIASDLQQSPEVNAGSFALEAVGGEGHDPDVGEPGTTGTLETLSGIPLPLEDRADHLGLPGERFTATHEQVAWFREYVARTTRHSCTSAGVVSETTTDPDEHTPDPFSDYEHRKTFAVPVATTAEFTGTFVATKWHFQYEVRGERHRRVLNHLLDAGLGAKRAYGFGCLAPIGTWGELSNA